jgi:hypothetical protein
MTKISFSNLIKEAKKYSSNELVELLIIGFISEMEKKYKNEKSVKL